MISGRVLMLLFVVLWMHMTTSDVMDRLQQRRPITVRLGKRAGVRELAIAARQIRYFYIAAWLALMWFTWLWPIPLFMQLIVTVLAGLVVHRALPRFAQQERDLIRQERRDAGCCLECGYDLRASSDRCPECGAPVRRELQTS